MSKSVIIRSAGQYESTLAATGTPCRERVYPTLEAAMMDLARVIPGDTKAIYADMEAVDGPDGFYVYRTEEDADADDTGADAIAVITAAPSVTVTLTDDGMGDESDEADYDAWVAYVTDRLSLDGVEVTIDAARFGEGGRTRVVAGGFADRRDIEQDVRDQLVTLWDAFCADESAWPA